MGVAALVPVAGMRIGAVVHRDYIAAVAVVQAAAAHRCNSVVLVAVVECSLHVAQLQAESLVDAHAEGLRTFVVPTHHVESMAH